MTKKGKAKKEENEKKNTVYETVSMPFFVYLSVFSSTVSTVLRARKTWTHNDNFPFPHYANYTKSIDYTYLMLHYVERERENFEKNRLKKKLYCREPYFKVKMKTLKSYHIYTR